MLVERLRAQWRVREAAGRFHETIGFEGDGLVLGAETQLAKAALLDQADLDLSAEQRLTTLLSVAYGRDVNRQSLGHLKAAVGRWRQGDETRASLHLALTGLGSLDRSGARRLFVADALIRAGIAPQVVLGTFESARADLALSKYNQDEDRIHAGNGRVSGRWTDGPGGGAAGQAPAKPQPYAIGHTTASAGAAVTALGVRAGAGGGGLDLAALSQSGLRSLSTFLAGARRGRRRRRCSNRRRAVSAFGVLFIPTSMARGDWVHVGGPGDVSYLRKPDEIGLQLRYTTADGIQHTTSGMPGPNGDYHDPKGRVIARAAKAAGKAGLIISTEELLGDDNDRPKLCPAPVKDNGGELGTVFEDYGKARFNPGNPTPHGMAFQFKIHSRAASRKSTTVSNKPAR